MSAGQITPQTVQIVEPDDGFTLRLARRPEAIVAEATICANALMTAVRKNKWAIAFSEGGKEHLYFEAWAFLATMYRVTARVKETRLLQIGDVTGYEATAEAFHIPSGVIISTADSMCLDDEERWSDRPVKEWKGGKRVATGEYVPVPLFQLRSMAQTRSMSRALKAPFSWIIAMAGFAPRAAEDASGDDAPEGVRKPPPATPQQKSEQAGNGDSAAAGNVISDKQAKRIWGIAYSYSVPNSVVGEILYGHGFTNPDLKVAAAMVTKDKYEAICAAIETKGEESQKK